MEEKIKMYQSHEDTLQFESFNSDDAWAIGCAVVERAKKENLKIIIDISVGRRTLFRYGVNGITAFNDLWVERKTNSVYMMQMSSMRFGLQLQRDNKRLGIECPLEPLKYATCGGGFPIIVKNTGVIGAIVVSGLADTEDHQIIVDAITEYLK